MLLSQTRSELEGHFGGYVPSRVIKRDRPVRCARNVRDPREVLLHRSEGGVQRYIFIAALRNITDPDQARLSETLIIENCFRHAMTWWRRCRPRIPVGRTQGQ
jgi:hypothetical protein